MQPFLLKTYYHFVFFGLLRFLSHLIDYHVQTILELFATGLIFLYKK